jgi:hypothetical protein
VAGSERQRAPEVVSLPHQVSPAPSTTTAAPKAEHLLRLQRTAGNGAVVQLLQQQHRLSQPRQPQTPLPLQRGWLSDAASWVGGAARAVGSAVASGARAVGSAVASGARAVGRGVSWLGDRIGDALDIRENEAVKDYREDRADLRTFRSQGVRGPRNLRAPTGIGGFGAAYDPRVEQMMVRLAGGVTFNNSVQFNGQIAVVNHPNPGPNLTRFVAQLNRLPAADRAAAAAPYLWAPSERTTFLSTFNANVRNRWSGQHRFHATKENWTDLGANVDVTSAIHAGAKAEDEHVSIAVYKTPPGGAGNVGVVNSGRGGATDNRMTLNSVDAGSRSDNLLEWSGTFPTGTNALNQAGRDSLNQIGATFRGGGPGCRVCGATILASSGGPTLTFHVSGDTEATARGRYQNMLSALGGGGNLDIVLRSQFRYASTGDGYRVVAGNGVAQAVAEHESGHMFGLGDEYATGAGSNITGTGAQAGGAARHDELVKDMGLEGAVFENNDGIMSLGTVVRPQHYATFHWALENLTGIDWALGPPVPVVPPPGAEVGDFPTPRDRTTAMA